MSRDEQEMIMWLSEYVRSTMRDAANRAAEADCAVEQFRKRYPPDPSATPATAPPAVWYDEPPFEKIDKTNHCWVQDIDSPQAVYWSNLQGEWRFFEGLSDTRPLNGRRVSPIAKPQEPTP